jgi:hypothetical protein
MGEICMSDKKQQAQNIVGKGWLVVTRAKVSSAVMILDAYAISALLETEDGGTEIIDGQGNSYLATEPILEVTKTVWAKKE